MPSLKLSSLVFGVLYTTLAVAGVLPPRDDAPVLTQAAIAIKLSPQSSGSSPASRRALTGASLVQDLVSKALAETTGNTTPSRKRDVQFEVLPLFNTITPEKIAEMVAEAVANDPTYVPADFGAWYQVQFTGSEDVESFTAEEEKLLQTLGATAEVTSAQRLATAPQQPQTPNPNTISPNDDPRFVDQGYLKGDGINAQYAWTKKGGDGANTTLIDVERGWFLTHEDLIGANITLRAGDNLKVMRAPPPENSVLVNDHGTAVLGEIFMQDNTRGGVGIAPKAKGGVVGISRFGQENPPQAIMDATAALKFGDAMLLEMQVQDVNQKYWPVEINDAEFDAIRLAVAKGITVIEPASNGGMNMDLPVTRYGETTPRGFLIKGHRDFRDSGAIMVGAGSPSVPHTRLNFSNYGGRVDTYAWGTNIFTTSSNMADDTNVYDFFDGTSGAAPIVAGAVLSVQGMISANRGGRKLNAAEMRTMIVRGGTPSANPTSDKIGVMPNLKALIDGGYLR
ncbi:Peptidase S8/S53 domain containing protein [Naviculisporaceae sp. PSN 640]